ncbi:hypothetical protein H5410_055514 [Solanum commersonii]|uniref:Uncharacterized protein n=1 Tax=Solanum commersonii TaxID=4109 RepID=A0A9J5WJK8_SOLCO|nr:hypothetical protein H5410_055514 [Solanum commersonii]
MTTTIYFIENELKKSEGEIEVICFAPRPHNEAPYQSELSINSEVALVRIMQMTTERIPSIEATSVGVKPGY